MNIELISLGDSPKKETKQSKVEPKVEPEVVYGLKHSDGYISEYDAYDDARIVKEKIYAHAYTSLYTIKRAKVVLEKLLGIKLEIVVMGTMDSLRGHYE